jgi:hypothetical protein
MDNNSVSPKQAECLLRIIDIIAENQDKSANRAHFWRHIKKMGLLREDLIAYKKFLTRFL